MIKKILLCFMIITVLTSCHPLTNEKTLQAIDNTSYEYSSILNKDKSVIFFKQTVSFEEAYPESEIIEITNLCEDTSLQVVGIDDYGNIYYEKECQECNEPDVDVAEILRYNVIEEKWENILKMQPHNHCNYIYSNEKYLLYMQDENYNWKRTSLHIYDLQEKKDVRFFTHTRDKKTNSTYVWQFASPILIDDTVYFEDCSGMDEDNIYQSEIYSYDIKNDKINKIASSSKGVMQYKGKPAWLEISKDKINSLVYSTFDNKYLYKAITGNGSIYSAKDNLMVVNDYISIFDFNIIIKEDKKYLQNEYEVLPEFEKKRQISHYGIKKIENREVSPILIAGYGGFATNVITNGNIVAWDGVGIGSPLIFNNEWDSIISFENVIKEDVFAYTVYLSENYLLLSYVNTNEFETAKEKIFLFKLQ